MAPKTGAVSFRERVHVSHEFLSLLSNRRREVAWALLAVGHDETLRQLLESLLAHDDSLGPINTARTGIHRIGPYQLLSKLGPGGMGQVYLAQGHASPSPGCCKDLAA